MNSTHSTTSNADKILNGTAIFWFVVAVIGQWMFVYYIAAHYGGATLEGDYAAWKKTSLNGYSTGDILGNLMFGAHMLMAAIITLGGTIQLVPQIRNRAAAIHRWNGRLFILTAILISLGGFYLVWVRGSSTTFVGAIGVSLNGVLIILFAAMAIKTARSGDFVAHRRWALRTFIMANGVWFFRVGFMAWILINQGQLWSTNNLDGPFDIFWSFANYLLPLAVLEIYLPTRERGSSMAKYAMAAGLFLLTILMGIGIFGAYIIMWQPNI